MKGRDLRSPALVLGPIAVVAIGITCVESALWRISRIEGRPRWGLIAGSEGCPDCRIVYWPHGRAYEAWAFAYPAILVVVGLLAYCVFAFLAERRAQHRSWSRAVLLCGYAIVALGVFWWWLGFRYMEAVGVFI